MKFSILTLAATLTCLLSGCANYVPYSPPPSGPEAQIRFVAHGTSHFVRHTFYGNPSGTCEGTHTLFGEMGGQFGFQLLADLKPIGMDFAEELKPNTFIERRIPAGKPYVVTAAVGLQHGSCRVSSIFVPEPGAQYQLGVAITWRECRTMLTKLTSDTTGKVTATILDSAQPTSCKKLHSYGQK